MNHFESEPISTELRWRCDWREHLNDPLLDLHAERDNGGEKEKKQINKKDVRAIGKFEWKWKVSNNGIARSS